METHDHLDGEDHQCASGRLVMDERLAYEKRLLAELPGNPAMVFVGIGFAMLAFMAMAVLPGIMDYMQDEGIIKPRIEIGQFGPFRGIHLRRNAYPAEVPAPHAQPQPYAPAPLEAQPLYGGQNRFGSPRE